MEKIILSSLSSAVLMLGDGSITAFADDLGPTDPAASPITEPADSNESTDPTEPAGPAKPPVIPTGPTEPSKPAEPTIPSEPEKPTEPTTPVDPGTPVEPTEPSEPTELSQPTEPMTLSEPEKSITPEQSKESTQSVIPEKPAELETPKTPEQSIKPIDVVTTSSGEVDKTNQSAGTQPNIPIEASNLAEVTHIPGETTLVTIEAKEETVAVDKGVPLTETPEGLKLISSLYKVLPSGNVEVKVNGRKMKVLSYTGEEFTLLFSVLGSFFVLTSGFLLFKRSKKRV